MEQPLEREGLVFGELVAGAAVAGLARVVRAEVARARTGGVFHRLVLGDVTGGERAAIRFDVGAAPAPAVGAVVRITGVVETFRGAASLKLTSCVAEPDVPAAAFLPRIPADRVATLADLDAMIDHLADPALRSWVAGCFDGDTRARLARHPAAVRHHAAAIGGLLTHTVRVGRIARQLAACVPLADPSIVLAASLLHDLGKIQEIRPTPGEGLTDEGILLGHVLLGARRAWAAADAIPDLAPERAWSVLHAMLAAHGKLEWGSPVVPATLEALIVHFADLIESKLEAALEAIEQAPAAEAWTAFLPAFGTRLRRSLP